VTIEGAAGRSSSTLRGEHGAIDALGFRVGDLAYLPDVSDIPKPPGRCSKGSTAGCSTRCAARRIPSHAHLEKSLGWIERAAPRRAVLTNMHIDMDYRTVAEETPEHVVPPMTGWSFPTMCEVPMLDILTVVLPVFLVTGAGYLAAWRGLFADSAVDGLMSLHPEIRHPLPAVHGRRDARPRGGIRPRAAGDLLHRVDRELRPRHLRRAVPVRTAHGPTASPSASCRSFANSVLLGLPITERAYGADALAGNFAIISIHAAYCYLLGITTMEIVKSGGSGGLVMVRKVVRAIFSNALMIGIALGLFRQSFRAFGAGRPAGGAGPDDPRRPARGSVRAGRHPLPLPSRGRSEHRRLHLRTCTFRTSRHRAGPGQRSGGP
jgi:hypothetical protein